MKTKPMFRYLCAASWLVALLVAPPSHAADTAKDEQAVKAVVAAFDNAMNAKDAAAFSNFTLKTRHDPRTRK